jgi:GNAT superfamily N-acetyltransferase
LLVCHNETFVVIEYRSFRNSDPPHLVDLWHASELGRGAALGFSYDAIDALNLAQPYFDRNGLIVACEGAQIVGFVHSGFGCTSEISDDCSKSTGVICAIVVHPQYRGQGIGRSLMTLAEDYLRERGATEFVAGPSYGRDPFFFGLYGGAQPSGFLESDPAAAPFLDTLGYTPVEKHAIYQCDASNYRGPSSFGLANLRRKTALEIADRPEKPDWWWATRAARLDSLHFTLAPKDGGAPLATVSVLGLDLYIQRWQERSVGLLGLETHDSERTVECGQLLLCETVRRLRQELVTRIEIHAHQADTETVAIIESSGFEQVDAGVVYARDAQTPAS